MFGINGYKILKCFRKEKRVSGELPCPATGLITEILVFKANCRLRSDAAEFDTSDMGLHCLLLFYGMLGITVKNYRKNP